MILVIFIGYRSIRLAIVVALLFLIIMSIANQQSIKEDFNDQVTEYMANYNLYSQGQSKREHFENPSDDVLGLNEDLEEEDNLDLADSTNQQDIVSKPMTSQPLLNMDQMNMDPKMMTKVMSVALDELSNEKRIQLSDTCRNTLKNVSSTIETCGPEYVNAFQTIENTPEIKSQIEMNVMNRMGFSENMQKPGEIGGMEVGKGIIRNNLKDIENRISQACAAFKLQ